MLPRFIWKYYRFGWGEIEKKIILCLESVTLRFAGDDEYTSVLHNLFNDKDSFFLIPQKSAKEESKYLNFFCDKIFYIKGETFE